MDFFVFIAEHYNYWIFIVLMMMGLYIVISRGNLIKKMIGLNVFQTSVFIYYISIGKITGGTAPIYVGDDMERRAEDAHHGAALAGKDALGQGALHADPDIDGGFNLAGNNLASLTEQASATHEGSAIHSTPDLPDVGANEILSSPTFSISPSAADGPLDVIYSNPLPHVLILTAIVVGIATTAVGLALIVRIREAYGTIEEDELEAEDCIAEFGKAHPTGGGA